MSDEPTMEEEELTMEEIAWISEQVHDSACHCGTPYVSLCPLVGTYSEKISTKIGRVLTEHLGRTRARGSRRSPTRLSVGLSRSSEGTVIRYVAIDDLAQEYVVTREEYVALTSHLLMERSSSEDASHDEWCSYRARLERVGREAGSRILELEARIGELTARERRAVPDSLIQRLLLATGLDVPIVIGEIAEHVARVEAEMESEREDF